MDTANPPPQHKDIAAATAAPTVLVVDDNRVNRLVATSMLKRLGVNCLEADSATAAQEVILQTRGQLKLILLDVSMPGMSGTTLCAWIKSITELASTKVIAYTAHAYSENHQQMRKDGFDDVLVKPISLESIEQCLHNNAFAFQK